MGRSGTRRTRRTPYLPAWREAGRVTTREEGRVLRSPRELLEQADEKLEHRVGPHEQFLGLRGRDQLHVTCEFEVAHEFGGGSEGNSQTPDQLPSGTKSVSLHDVGRNRHGGP